MLDVGAAALSLSEISNDSVAVDVAGAGAAAPPSSGDNQEGVSVIVCDTRATAITKGQEKGHFREAMR